MRRIEGFISTLFIVTGCSNQAALTNPNCSTVQSIAATGSVTQSDLQSGRVPTTWGGAFDVLEDASQPETSKRYRCTMHMDLVPQNSNKPYDPKEIAFWTADHCLQFAKAQSVELQLFDPDTKSYIRLNVKLPDLEKYRQGLALFEERAKRNSPDATAESDFSAFLKSAARSSVDFEGTPLIERGAPLCQQDTTEFKKTRPKHTVICSSVLDLARVTAFVTDDSMARPEVADALRRMSQTLKLIEEGKQEHAKKIVKSGPDLVGYLFYLKTWRVKVGDLTRWRRYESQSALIEKVRSCAAEDQSGICAQPFRDFFKDALEEYKVWVSDGNSKTFMKALKDEVYADVSNTKHNLKWLLQSQKAVEEYKYISSEVRFSTNLLRKPKEIQSKTPLPTLGEQGPLYYGLLNPFGTDSLQDGNLFGSQIMNEKTILFPYNPEESGSMSLFLQPGDSGSMWLTGHVPIGVVATVDGVETSGGASIRPLPEAVDEEKNAPAPARKTSCMSDQSSQNLKTR